MIAFSEKPSVTLREGDFITIKAHEKHRVQWTDPDQETVWLAVHYES
jgi:cupin 2 domain-containing protein